MSKGSEDAKSHEHGPSTHAHSHSSAHGDEEFLSQVRALKDAEGSAALRVEEGKKQAAEIEASAREQAVEILSKAQQKGVEAKNEIMAKQRDSTDSEIHSIMDAARKKAATIKAKRLNDSEIAAITQKI